MSRLQLDRRTSHLKDKLQLFLHFQVGNPEIVCTFLQGEGRKKDAENCVHFVAF